MNKYNQYEKAIFELRNQIDILKNEILNNVNDNSNSVPLSDYKDLEDKCRKLIDQNNELEGYYNEIKYEMDNLISS